MTIRISNFTRALNSGRLVVTAECMPPRGADADAVRDFAGKLPQNLDAVVVADNPDAIRSSAISAAVLMKKMGRDNVILSMTTRDRNRLALMSDALGAAALGVSAILCVSGNHQSLDICPQAASANDLDSVQFIYALKSMILHGSGLGGNKVEPRPDLQVGAVAHPYMRPMDLNLLRIRKKISAGADFLMTQAVFDIEGFGLWMQSMRAAGFDKRVAIIPSVMPVAGVEEAGALRRRGIYGPIADGIIARIERASDPRETGVAIASDIAAKLKDMPGVCGIHILSSGRETLAADVIERAGIGAGSLCGVA
jgi:methylenetetrahydrofolate reductase (NADPH)